MRDSQPAWRKAIKSCICHGRKISNHPAEITQTKRCYRATVPWLLLDPLYRCEAVAPLIVIRIECARRSERAPAALHYHVETLRGERIGSVRSEKHAFAIGRA